MSRRARLIPVFLMGGLAIGYVMLRARIAATLPYATILEFPLGAAVVGILLWMALGRRRPAPTRPWRRHRQVVRHLPDPALVPDVRALERWIETGAAPDAAADVLARSSTSDEGERERMRRAILAELSTLATPRKRESYLKQQLQPGV